MSRIVIKLDEHTFVSPDRIDQITKRIINEKNKGVDVVVVVPYIHLIDEKLRQYAYTLSEKPTQREIDSIRSTNTQIASSLLSIALNKNGFQAISLTGWQAGISTVTPNRNVLIDHIESEKVNNYLKTGVIPIIAGGQGVDQENNITLLGEGGPETTAVGVAVAIGAERVDIYTNAVGVFTADPKIVKTAKKIKQISYDEMLELSLLGSKIIHPRAVELAKKFNMPLNVCSSIEDVAGTLIKGELEMERNLIVRGVAYETDIIRLTVGYESYGHASLASLFTTLAENHINVDIIVQAVIDGVKPTVSFSIEKEVFAEAISVLETNKKQLGFGFADFEVGLAKVSIVGSGMASNPGVAARMFDRLKNENIQVKMVSTSEIKVSVVVPQDDMVRAANALHDEFNLVEELV
ncbi:aspartate kinase [Ureibacillus manganicus]|uniref:Aspartokinase n=1 Tax=Ureibacillus manganicus DSM 26584 TaxID=1384049 RepID=A0A0A3I7M3_9BACL|nr:aspartate kinase [Ureibacillus manganicus]KGR78738.1 aspartate kinase [Ureibacillus manganicus DSM 26584]